MRDLKVAVYILLSLVICLLALLTKLYNDKRPQTCTKVHPKPWEYRVTIDGTDSILKYTFIVDGTDTIVNGCTAAELDQELYKMEQ